MDEVDPLVSAVSEVSSVANQLREIKRKVEQYGQASARLEQVSNAVSQLAAAVTGIHGEFGKLLLTANEVLVTAEQQRSEMAVSAAGIPEIVQRIEASDASKSVLISDESQQAHWVSL